MIATADRFLINGCSFTRGPVAWPYHLKSIDQQSFTNLALSSAGNTYIHESTIYELSQRSYQGVIIMWSGLSRVDAKVESIDLFDNTWYTSNFQRTTNDWQEKIVEPINDQDYVDPDWVFGLGHQNQDPVITERKIFDGLYRYQNLKQFAFHFLIKLISLQNTLKSMNIPYVFTFYQPYQMVLQTETNLCKLVDWNNIYTKQNIYEIAKQNNDVDQDNHPGLKSNQIWAEIMDKVISTKILKEVA